MAISKEDIERLINIYSSDNSFFSLAVHSLEERELRNYANEKEYHDSFYEICQKAYCNQNIPKEAKIQLNRIQAQRKETDAVRHSFKRVEPAFADATGSTFLKFASGIGVPESGSYGKLKDIIDDGLADRKRISITEEEFERLKEEYRNSVKKDDELKAFQLESEELRARLQVLENELASTRKRLEKEDTKFDEKRKENFELKEKTKKQEKDLAELKDRKADLEKQIQVIKEKFSKGESALQTLSYMRQLAIITTSRREFERARMQLSPEQQEILEQINIDHDYLIKGSAGSGKTLMLLELAKKVVKEGADLYSNNSFLFLTFANSLMRYTQYLAELSEMEGMKDKIKTVDSFLFGLSCALLGKSFAYGAEDKDALIERCFDGDFEAFDEAENFIWANNISREQYIDKMCERIGRKTQMQKAARVAMWKKIEEASQRLEAEGKWPPNYALTKILKSIKARKPAKYDYSFFFVDEVQDLEPIKLMVIKELSGKAVFMAGDADQSIYRATTPLQWSGIEIQGRTKILHTNFRNSIQINDLAEKYKIRTGLADKEREMQAYRSGLPIKSFAADSFEELLDRLCIKINLYCTEFGYDRESMCILAYSTSKLDQVRAKLDETGIPNCDIKSKDFSFDSEGIRLSTIHSCKGFDFPIVFFLADEDLHSENLDEKSVEKMKHNLVYTAITRATDILEVLSLNSNESAAVKDLIDLIE